MRVHSFISEAHTYNQRAVASYLDDRVAGASGDFRTVLADLDNLSGNGARAAFDSLSGELYGSLSTVRIENTERFLRTVAWRLRSRSMSRETVPSSNLASLAAEWSQGDPETVWRGQASRESRGRTPWIEGYGVGANIAGNGNAHGLGYSLGGTALGIESPLSHATLFGIVGGCSQTTAALNGRADQGTIDSYSLGAYLHRDKNDRYATAIATFGFNQYQTRRQIAVGPINRTAKADYNGNEFAFYLERGHNYRWLSGQFQPYAALEYIHVNQGGFIESDADSVNLAVAPIHAGAFRTLLGTRLSRQFATGGGRLISLEGRALWRHELLDQSRIIDAQFAGQPGGAFAVAGLNVDRDAAILGGGLTVHPHLGLKLYLNYDVMTSENCTAHAGTGGLVFLR
jgi:outer membrane autotransporter protein